MKTIMYENFCSDCGWQHQSKKPNDTCDLCKSQNTWSVPFIICDCGTRVYLQRNTNECWECNKLYDSNGERKTVPKFLTAAHTAV